MSFYKLAKARVIELERPEKKIKLDYGETKRVDIAKYHDDLTKGKIKQDYDSIKSHHHDKLNHSDYLISQTNLGKTDLLKNKLLSERMAQLNATTYQPVQEVDINLGIGSSNAVVQEVNQVIGDFIQKISSGVFDLTMTNDLYKLYKLIQTQTYKFGSDLLERYKSYFEDVKDTLDLDETADVVRSYSRKDSSVLDLMKKIVNNSIQIINKMLEAIAKGSTSEERKQILEQNIKNISFKKIDTTYLKELSDEIKNLEKSKKSEKDARKTKKLQVLLEQLKNIEKSARMPDMQKQALLLEEEEQRRREQQENQGMMEQEQETREVNEEQRRIDEERQESERQEEQRRLDKIQQEEEKERERIMRIREEKLQREREAREAEEAELLRKYEELTQASEMLGKQLDFISVSKKRLRDDAFPEFITSISPLYPELKRKDVSRLVRGYVSSVRDGTDASNTFITDLYDKSETDAGKLLALANEVTRLDLDEARIYREMDSVKEEISRIPTTIEDRTEEIFRDLREEITPETVPEPVLESESPVSIPKEKPLYKTTEYTSNANKIELTNGDVYYRNKEQFIEKQSKIALTKLLTKLDIDFNKWSATTKGSNEANVKAFRTKAWDILKDNPKLKLKGGNHWFKK
jgi:hypothetical protein